MIICSFLSSKSKQLSLLLSDWHRFTDLLTIEKDMGRQLRGKSLLVISVSKNDDCPEEYPKPFERSADYLGMEWKGYAHFPVAEKTVCDQRYELVSSFLAVMLSLVFRHSHKLWSLWKHKKKKKKRTESTPSNQAPLFNRLDSQDSLQSDEKKKIPSNASDKSNLQVSCGYYYYSRTEV